jgi:hypothetical protein
LTVFYMLADANRVVRRLIRICHDARLTLN